MRCSSCSEEVRPVVALDIDGTMADYHNHFLRFAESWLDKPWSGPAYNGSQEYREWFCSTFGVDITTFRSIKLAYRQGGLKRTQPIFSGAVRLAADLRDEGADLWLTTTRPHDRYDRVDPDTREWLRRHSIDFDGLLYSGDKMRELSERVEPARVVAVMDDLPSVLFSAAELFGPEVPIMAAGSHNVCAGWVGEWRSLESARTTILQRIYNWINNKEKS